MSEYERFEMLYCDGITCRVNTFESGHTGACPGCGWPGEKLNP